MVYLRILRLLWCFIRRSGFFQLEKTNSLEINFLHAQQDPVLSSTEYTNQGWSLYQFELKAPVAVSFPNFFGS